MDLWHGPASEFFKHAVSRALPVQMLGAYYRLHRMQPSPAESAATSIRLVRLQLQGVESVAFGV